MIVNQIFASINGEVSNAHQGSLCTFIRLAGCNLKCLYCDTSYARSAKDGKEMDIDSIIDKVRELGNRNITITGGEPMLQAEEMIFLALCLWLSGWEVSVETNGTFMMEPIRSINWVADWKGPSSGMRDSMNIANYQSLRPADIVKFVIEDYPDFIDAVLTVQNLPLCKIAFSPSYGKMDPVQLTEWMKKEPMLRDRGAIFSWQIHKLLDLKERDV